MLRPAYLSKKLARPLPTKDGGTLRTVLEAHTYMLRLSKDRERNASGPRRPGGYKGLSFRPRRGFKGSTGSPFHSRNSLAAWDEVAKRYELRAARSSRCEESLRW
jgi:hypothetical protein